VIGIATDSNSQLPPELAARYGVEVVPLTVTIDGEDYAEGVDLDADAFYARFESGKPEVSTSQPSPGRFGEAYAALAERGANEILSIHLGSALSGTLNSARLAARDAPIPVRLVDTGTASFGISCCVWEAAEALATGATVDEAVTVAESVVATVGNVFVVQALDLARAGGRVRTDAALDQGDGIPVLSLVDGEIKAVGQARDVDGAADVMARHALAWGDSLRVAIGIADAGAAPFWQALERRLDGAPEVKEMVRYRVGPSVGVHSGPGTAGAFFYPAR
jgi:DegV family protein with EDD domain